MKTSLVVCLAALWLPSCTNEEAPVSTDTGNTYTAQVRMTASREMFDGTRSSLTDNGDGKLTPAWEVGDKVYVTTVFEGSQNESYAGTLEVVSTSNNGQSAEFSGSVSGAVYNGDKAYKFYFFGNNTKFDGEIAEKKYDFSTQNGLMPTLQDDDLLIGKANIKFTDGAGTVNVPFQRQFSYAHYKLVYDGQELATKGVEISISADNLAATASVDFDNANITSGGVAPIKVTPTESNDFYVALVPNYEETTLTFICQVDGVNFIGTRKLSNNKNNKFYRSNEEGHGAIPIVMTPVKQYRVIYHVKFGNIDENDRRECTSIPYVVSGDPTQYKVLNFESVTKDSNKTTIGEADFTKGYLCDFLGWGTASNEVEGCWAATNWGVEYSAKESKDADASDNGVVDLTKVSTKEVEVNGQTYYDLDLYAKGSVMSFNLYAVYEDEGGKLRDAFSSSDNNRITGWAYVAFETANTLTKSGYEFMGWSRSSDGTINGVLVDKENPIQSAAGVRVRVDKNSPYGILEADYTGSFVGRPIRGKYTLTLYPVWKKIENGTIDITNYGTGTLE